MDPGYTGCHRHKKKKKKKGLTRFDSVWLSCRWASCASVKSWGILSCKIRMRCQAWDQFQIPRLYQVDGHNLFITIAWLPWNKILENQPLQNTIEVYTPRRWLTTILIADSRPSQKRTLPTKRHSCQSRSWSCTTDGSTGQRCHRNGRCTPAQAYRCDSAGGGRSHALPRSSHSRQPPISPVNSLRMLYPCPWWQELPTNHILELELHIKPTKKIKFKMHLNISKLVWYISYTFKTHHWYIHLVRLQEHDPSVDSRGLLMLRKQISLSPRRVAPDPAVRHRSTVRRNGCTTFHGRRRTQLEELG